MFIRSKVATSIDFTYFPPKNENVYIISCARTFKLADSNKIRRRVYFGVGKSFKEFGGKSNMMGVVKTPSVPTI